MILLITGPTAIGKTKLSLVLASLLNDTFIVSVDSRQVYKLMDIGTDKVSKEIRKTIIHYLIDVVNPNVEFSLFDFLNKVEKIIEYAIKKNKNLILVGGTLLYVYSLIEGYSLWPTNNLIRKKYEKLDICQLKEIIYQIDKRFNTDFCNKIKDKRRMVRIAEVVELTNKNPLELWKNNRKFPIDKIFILSNKRSKIYEDINKRVNRQIEEGLIEEVKFILKKFPSAESFKSMKTFGYYEIIQFLKGKLDLLTAIELIKRNTRKFAKRQLSFIKNKIIPKLDNINGQVIDVSSQDFNQIAKNIIKIIKNDI